jgi:hypothetical protein
VAPAVCDVPFADAIWGEVGAANLEDQTRSFTRVDHLYLLLAFLCKTDVPVRYRKLLRLYFFLCMVIFAVTAKITKAEVQPHREVWFMRGCLKLEISASSYDFEGQVGQSRYSQSIVVALGQIPAHVGSDFMVDFSRHTENDMGVVVVESLMAEPGPELSDLGRSVFCRQPADCGGLGT